MKKPLTRSATAKNPHRVAAPSPIVYEGEQGGFHCFRVVLRDTRGLAAHSMSQSVATWAINNLDRGHYHIGNGFGDQKDHPAVDLSNPDDKDLFVLLLDLVDVVLFENAFAVDGYSPTMVL